MAKNNNRVVNDVRKLTNGVWQPVNNKDCIVVVDHSESKKWGKTKPGWTSNVYFNNVSPGCPGEHEEYDGLYMIENNNVCPVVVDDPNYNWEKDSFVRIGNELEWSVK